MVFFVEIAGGFGSVSGCHGGVLFLCGSPFPTRHRDSGPFWLKATGAEELTKIQTKNRIWGLGFKVFGFWVSGFGFRVSGFGFWA